jgi:hypothetical protein
MSYLIDDTKTPSGFPDYVTNVRHDSSLGTVPWDLNRIVARHVRGQGDDIDPKNVPYASVKDEVGKIPGWKPLSANVADWLMQNPDKYPLEWEGKCICFFATEVDTIHPDTGVVMLSKQKDEQGISKNIMFASNSVSYNVYVAMIRVY